MLVLTAMGSKRNHSRMRKRQHKYSGDMENIKAIESLRASKTLNSPFNSKIPNVEEDADNYNIIINFGLFVSFIKQFLCCPDYGSNNVIIVDRWDFDINLSFLVMTVHILRQRLPHNYVINLKKYKGDNHLK